MIQSVVDFIVNNLYTEDPLICSVCLAIIFLISYDFYHLLFSAVTSWLKKDK